MRVLFVTWAWPSHLYAMVPLAWACRAAGHEVLVASQPGLRESIWQTGLTGVSVGEDIDAVDLVRNYLLPSQAGDQGDKDTVDNGSTPIGGAQRTGKGPRALQMFIAHAESMVDDLVQHAQGWKPDVVVFEPTALAGPLVAAAVGVPAVRQLYGVDLMYQARTLLPQLLEPLAGRHEVSNVDPLGAATIDPVPPSLRLPAKYNHHLPMRYVPFNGPGVPAPQLPARTSRPRVCITWGTTIFRLDPTRFLAVQAISALQHLDVEIVAAVTPDQYPSLPRPVGNNVHIIRGVPLYLTLPTCDLLISHGGAGTLLTGLSHGLPQLLIPQLPDHAGHAARILATGVGAVLTKDKATPEQLKTETLRLLQSADEHAAAKKLQQEMQQLPPPAAIVDELERIGRLPR
ncbi:MAG TPA: nucleotide disphospho-sugar-binding domain-containing protein [Pseudonocardiaceae bacterium]|nr:nucleotide disphospho-sugar-binding domain-containing protein [Pseudonocardiaceae bacterium]